MWIVIWSVLGILCALGYSFYRKRRWDMALFERLGIPGPTPHWLVGNLYELYYGSQEPHEVFQQWTAIYGRTYGYFEGSKPHIATSDPDLTQEVLVKNFSKFNGRKIFSHMTQSDRDNAGMAIANGLRWKRLRSIINPTFSTAKLKTMIPMMLKKMRYLESNIRKSRNTDASPVEVLQYYQRLTLAAIGSAAFGMNVDPQNNPDDQYLSTCRALFGALSARKRPFFIKFVDIFPEFRQIARVFIDLVLRFSPINRHSRWIGARLDKVIKERRQQKEKLPDLLQLMLDAEVDTLDSPKENSVATNGCDTGIKIGPVEKKLTNEELRQQGILFLIAGYETTSTTLSYVTQTLATNPDVQRKLLTEIDQHLPNKCPITYEAVQKMNYLDMVISETLRLYPAAAMAVVRECFQECTLNGIHFPKGVNVLIDVWSVHYNTDIWGTDADKFIPERFDKEENSRRHPMAWMPFGAGPKNCVGQRFALMEIKLAFCYLLQRISFQRCDQTQEPLILENNMVTVPRDGVTVSVVPREASEE